VVNDHHDDGESTEKIETRLTFAIGKARVDSEPEWRCSFAHGISNCATLAEAWPPSSFPEHVAKYDCFKQSIFPRADICAVRGRLRPHFSYCNASRIRATRNCGAIPRNNTTAAANTIVSLESLFEAKDESDCVSVPWVWKITFKTMR
jgi:hypothetical protein